MSRWKATTSDLPLERWSEVELLVYGIKNKFKLPLVDSVDDTREDVSQGLIEYVSTRAQMKYIQDVVLGFRTELIKGHAVYRKGEAIVFKSLNTSGKKIDVKNPGVLVMMKEFLDGYELSDDYSLKVKVGDGKQMQDMQIQQDYDVESPTGQGRVTIKNNYTAALRYNIFAKMKQFATGELDNDQPLMFDRQYDVLKRMGKRTVFVAPRRAGKSVILAFMAMRAMMKETRAKALRPTSVLYIGLNEKSLGQVIHYLQKMRESLGEYWNDTFHYDSKHLIFSFRKGKKVLGTITFLSAEGSSPGVGLAADCVIIDEAFKIPRSIREGVEPMVLNENADLICASTMYYDAKKDWFYELLVQYEAQYNRNNDVDADILKRREEKKADKTFRPEHFCGLRYTVDDPASMTPKQVEALKKQFAKNPERYFCELYGRVPDEGKVFKYEDSLQMRQDIEKHRFKYIVLAYDPALRRDKSALVVLGYCPDIQRICVLEEQILNRDNMSSYTPQAQIIKNTFNLSIVKYQVQRPMVFFVMDTTGAQTAIADLMVINGINIDMRVFYGRGDKVIENKQIDGEYKVPKTQLVNVTKLLMESGSIQISSDMNILLKQLDNFYQIDIDKYEGVGESDDHVNALMLGVFLLHERMGLKYSMLKKQETVKSNPTGLTYDEIRQIKLAVDNGDSMKEIQDANADYFRRFVY